MKWIPVSTGTTAKAWIPAFAGMTLVSLADKGRVDAVLELEKRIYIIELKLGSAQEALKQIKEKRYYEKFENSSKKITFLGIGGFLEKQIEFKLELM